MKHPATRYFNTRQREGGRVRAVSAKAAGSVARGAGAEGMAASACD